MATQLTDQDVFVSNTNPTTNVNPKVVGALWINYVTGKVYVCKNNTQNTNEWILTNPDPIKPKPDGIGYGQRWYNMKSQRRPGVNYTNDTDKPIMVWIDCGKGRKSNYFVDGILAVSSEEFQENSFIVPPGSTYKVDTSAIYSWNELR